MKNPFRPCLTIIGAAITALGLIACLLGSIDTSISPRNQHTFEAAERFVGLRPVGRTDINRVIPVLRDGFRATIAIMTPTGRIMCSGSIIKNEPGKEIEVLTAWHCVRAAFPSTIPVGLLHSGEVIPMIVFKKSEDWDLAMLTSLYPTQVRGPTVKIADQGPPLGETIWIIGHPKGILGNITRGVLSNVLHVGYGLRYYRIDAPIFYGNSGGGMFNRNGELIGVADAVEYSRNPDGSSQLVPGGGLCVSLYNVRQFVAK